METPAWSRDRLRDPASLELLVRIFKQHEENPEAEITHRTSEAERLRVVPLVFGLLPEAALVREKPDQRIKPVIVEHLHSVGIPASDILVSTLKRLADQYFESMPRPPHARRRKVGIESVRALRLGIYSRLQKRQGGRCAICGIRFGAGVVETLDHILPWRLAGDPYDGSNWQLLCVDCNSGKREWLSALQSAQSLNWLYGLADESSSTTLETRYLALTLAGKCQFNSCLADPRISWLQAVRRHPTGLPVLDNLDVRCEQHLTGPIAAQTTPVADSFRSLPAQPPAVLAELENTETAVERGERFGGYLLSRRITSGGMAECFVGVSEENGESIFLKRVREDSGDLPALQREAEIYQKLELRGAEHTLRVIEVRRCDGYFMLVTECAEYDLESYVLERGALATNEVKRIAFEIIEGLKELHEAQLVHRDLKPGNILRYGGKWVLADFGITKDRRVVGGGRTFRLMGTTGYSSPEQLLTGIEAEPSADVYALGKVLVFLLTGGTDLDRILLRQWRKLIRDCTAEAMEQRLSLATVLVEMAKIDE